MPQDNESPKRERLIGLEEAEEDVLSLSLRPSSLSDFVGQKSVVDNLIVAIKAAKKRSEPLEHVLFSGPPGLGKTTLAYIIAHEMGTKMTSTSGPAIERPGDLIGILTNLSEGDVLFIDEVHRMPKIVEEFLYPAMENFQIDFIIDRGPYAKTIKFNLKRFTLIGATTRSGLLSAALRDRFGMFYHMDFYEPGELVNIIKRSASILGIHIDSDGALEVAKRARGTPRIANRLLRRVRDWTEVKADGTIIKMIAEKALNDQGIDTLGLDSVDRKVIKSIMDFYKGGPVGIESLAATLNEEEDTIVDVVEPFLLKIGFLKRTSRGRELTGLAYEHMGVSVKRSPQKEFL
ncbi:MAG: Holliday junction branch migration DNA helicase RuvB [Candidatus Omnitrophica bacterium]|nr:Holliday junction branch migration DNA helicase RuvB [Candidatus Omnitrophota bacterium]MBU4487753.1 Holliday junction branch migration DNA helicase RuvB [Candidatus Omnitrophota bacterium]MCG2705711.1 Holliday junction branch migration DNA helicase RuvB [Candidatus Omnitrophota bacterium]